MLVLELRPPEFPTFEALLLLWPTWLGYAVSYLSIAIVSTNHHYLMRYATEATSRLVWFNFAHLFSMSLLPLSTAWMAVSKLAPPPGAFYAAVFFLVNAAQPGRLARPARRPLMCAVPSGSWGGQRPSRGGYVPGTRATRGVTARRRALMLAILSIPTTEEAHRNERVDRAAQPGRRLQGASLALQPLCPRDERGRHPLPGWPARPRRSQPARRRGRHPSADRAGHQEHPNDSAVGGRRPRQPGESDGLHHGHALLRRDLRGAAPLLHRAPAGEHHRG